MADNKQKKVKSVTDNEPESVGITVTGAKVSAKGQSAGTGKAGQYAGMILLLLAFVLAVVVTCVLGEGHTTENLIMTVFTALCVLLATIGYLTVGIVFGAAVIVGYAGFKIYSLMVIKDNFSMLSFLWVIIPVMAVAGIALFINGYSKLTLDNALLKKQISELVMTDPVTGLYNLRSMFMDIQTQISYSERNDTAISLMITRLRYPAEMKKVLKTSEYEQVIKQLALLLVDTVRLEDKVYSIDDDGGFGIILTCGTDGTRIVEKRLRDKLADPKWFENVSSKHQVRAELKIGSLQYDKNKYKRDANAFKQDVEEEVEYDM